jgi:hypothetical protein
VTISAAERAKYPPPALSPRTHRFHPRAIIGIGGPPRQALLGGPIAGLNNAKEALFQLCRRGRKISYPTLRASSVLLRLASVTAMEYGMPRGDGVEATRHRRRRWNARVPNTPPLPSIPHETLWDVDHWNAYVSNHSGCGLPHMVRDRPTTLIKTPGFANSLWLNTFRSGTQTRRPVWKSTPSRA